MIAGPECAACGGRGWVRPPDGTVDACGACATAAEATWRAAQSPAANLEDDMAFVEVKAVERRGYSTAGTLTLEARALPRGIELRLVAYPAVLREVPWYRGGAGVSVVLGDRGDTGKVRIVREGPHLLLAQGNTLEKLPPVVLRLAAFAWMDGEPHAAAEVPYAVWPAYVEFDLPAWARHPLQVAPAYVGAVPRRVFNSEMEPLVRAGGAA